MANSIIRQPRTLCSSSIRFPDIVSDGLPVRAIDFIGSSPYPRRVMLDRSQHLKLFLTGSGDGQEDVDVVLVDKRVQNELNRHPVNWDRFFRAVPRVSHFKFNSAQEVHFMQLFGSYR